MVAGGDLHEISLAIGALRSDVKNLAEKIDRAEKSSEENVRKYDQHRATIHKRVDDLVDSVSALATKVEVMQTDVADSKVVTDKVRMWEQRGIGALFVAGIAGTAVGGTVVGFIVYWWEAILRLLKSG